MALLVFSLAYKGNSDSCQYKQGKSTSRECTIPECVHTWVWKRQQPPAKPDFSKAHSNFVQFREESLKRRREEPSLSQIPLSQYFPSPNLNKAIHDCVQRSKVRNQDTWQLPSVTMSPDSKSFCPLLKADVFPLGPPPHAEEAGEEDPLPHWEAQWLLAAYIQSHLFCSSPSFFPGPRPHRAVWGIRASVKPRRFPWSLSAQARSPSLTSANSL